MGETGPSVTGAGPVNMHGSGVQSAALYQGRRSKIEELLSRIVCTARTPTCYNTVKGKSWVIQEHRAAPGYSFF